MTGQDHNLAERHFRSSEIISTNKRLILPSFSQKNVISIPDFGLWFLLSIRGTGRRFLFWTFTVSFWRVADRSCFQVYKLNLNWKQGKTLTYQCFWYLSFPNYYNDSLGTFFEFAPNNSIFYTKGKLMDVIPIFDSVLSQVSFGSFAEVEQR